jgi:hypothetical protein
MKIHGNKWETYMLTDAISENRNITKKDDAKL